MLVVISFHISITGKTFSFLKTLGLDPWLNRQGLQLPFQRTQVWFLPPMDADLIGLFAAFGLPFTRLSILVAAALLNPQLGFFHRQPKLVKICLNLLVVIDVLV